MPRRVFVAVFAASWLSLGLAACRREERLRAQAQSFLSIYEATDHRSPIPERERKVAELAELPVTEEVVQKARDECVGAHRALIRAERENEGAAGQLERALAAQPPGEPLAAADTERIRGSIEQAERSLSDARSRFKTCEEYARGLSLRFGAEPAR